MKLSKLIPSRYLIPPTSKYFFSKRRRSLEKQEQKQLQEQQEDCQEQQEIEQVLIDYTEFECAATLYNLEMVTIEDQSTLVFQEDREVTEEEVGETHEIERVSTSQRQEIEREDIRKYGLATEYREEPAEEERGQEIEERDREVMQLRKAANRNATRINEDDYSPSCFDTLCFSSKATPDLTEVSKEDVAVTSDAFQVEQNKEAQKPFDRLVGGHLYKEHKDDHIGICIKDSMTKEGVYISQVQIGSRLKWSTDVSLEGMRILSINGLPCPSDLEDTVDMMKEAEGDLKLVAAAIELPKPIPPLEEDEESQTASDVEDDQDASTVSSSSSEDETTAFYSDDRFSAFSDDKISQLTDDKTNAITDDKTSALPDNKIRVLTDEKEHDRQPSTDDRTFQDHDSKGEGEEEMPENQEEAPETSSLALVREQSTVHYL